MVSTEPPASPDPAQDDSGLPEQIRVRRAKRAEMLASGHDPYPVAVPRTHTLREVRGAHPDLPPDTATGDRVGVTGRVIFQRNTGKLCFATLREGDGTELQAMLSLARVGAEELARWKAEVDLGDHVFVEGEVITSKRGELSVMADGWAMASKAVRPLPVAHRELNEETRVRQRYVDLIVRPQARDMVRTRAQVVRTVALGIARPRVRRGRDADAAAAARRGDGAPVRHARQCARHRSVPADRAGAVPEAHGGRRHRAGLRDQPQLPQRGHRLHALAGVRDARGISGVWYL